MIVLRTPKGWTGPKEIDDKKVEGSFRAHQVPIAISPDEPENLPLLEKWLKSYKVDKLFDSNGRLIKELRELGVELIFGSHPDDILDSSFDYLIKNPGVPIDHKYVLKARELGVEVINEVEMSFKVNNTDYSPTFDESYFEVNSIINTTNQNNNSNSDNNNNNNVEKYLFIAIIPPYFRPSGENFAIFDHK